MGKALKTKEVAKRLGVSSRTIQRWVRNFNLPYQTNSRGHYAFEEHHIRELEKIRDQLYSSNGGEPKEKKEADKGTDQAKSATPSEQLIQEKLERMEIQLNQLEKNLASKADEVVYEQLLLHRRELDQLAERIARLEVKMDEMCSQLDQLTTDREEETKPKKRFAFFSLAR